MKSTQDMKIYINPHRNCINQFIEVELLDSSVEIGPHADALVLVKALLCTLQIGTRPLLDKGCGDGTC
jgi:hypothetical protein